MVLLSQYLLRTHGSQSLEPVQTLSSSDLGISSASLMATFLRVMLSSKALLSATVRPISMLSYGVSSGLVGGRQHLGPGTASSCRGGPNGHTAHHRISRDLVDAACDWQFTTLSQRKLCLFPKPRVLTKNYIP
ncbi:hypothetical protein SPBR_01088 [Sporothrix brasiliensis 5110]|uniref:Uncharacterized protein n=1 Tax=Sporothrix brasiliensis 5110 TaxID=1398154 RepID=A0A0C2FIE9_9PEZI|nr:uncharacterized protein SPBR_01088 [Sporothrix brasiliensis 5110]KIH90843.1 hypothetical protein SPBR_01088 [Sporothrix brasiliensis 5110]